MREGFTCYVGFEGVVLELIYLLVMELLGVDYGVGVKGEFLSQADEGEVVFKSLDPVVEGRVRDLDFVSSFHCGLGLG